MKAISLWQPWASLLFVQCATADGAPQRVKPHETRSWKPPAALVGQRIAIHASLRRIGIKAKNIPEELHELCMDVFGCAYNFSLPYGAVLGTMLLDSFVSTNELLTPERDDYICGDWTTNRFAWKLTEPDEFKTPIWVCGAQKFWNWDQPQPEA